MVHAPVEGPLQGRESIKAGGERRQGGRLVLAASQIVQDIGHKAKHNREVPAVHGLQRRALGGALDDRPQVREVGEREALAARFQGRHLGGLPQQGSGLLKGPGQRQGPTALGAPR
ncbi:MAG: hypothetical protein HY284_01865 [Nitrospirae bacterium]|nr:hypothetical protein [Nitrospirota bacterium]